MIRDLTALFDPKTVAVLGASNDETKYGNWLSVQAVRMTDTRTVHLVNRRGESILGRPALRSLAELDEPVDLVVVTVPAHGFEAAVDDALAAGARAIVGVTAGFAELGADGRALQDRVVERVRAAGAVLLGPNCLGVLDSSTSLTLASNPLPAGRIALLSQSGNMALEVSGFLAARGHGFSRFVSLGNQADLGAADLIQSCIEHPGTDLIAVYCEDFGDGRAFVAAATAAAEAGKPVLLLTVGGSEASIRGAQSHTGALTSDSAVIDAACRAAGIHRVASPRQLADTAATLLSYGARAVHRVGVIADGGGHAGVASDVVEATGLSVPQFAAEVSATLREVLPPSAGVANPVDLAGAGEQDITSFVSVLDAVLGSADIDSVLVTGYFGGYGDYGEGLSLAELDVAARWRKWLTHTASRWSCTPCAPRARPRAFSPTPVCRCSTRWRTPQAPLRCCTTPAGRGRCPCCRTWPSSPSPPPTTGMRANCSAPRASRFPLRGWFATPPRRARPQATSATRWCSRRWACCTSPTPVASPLALPATTSSPPR